MKTPLQGIDLLDSVQDYTRQMEETYWDVWRAERDYPVTKEEDNQEPFEHGEENN